MLIEKEFLNRRTAIKPPCKGRDDANALRLKRTDHVVVMRGITAQNIGPHEQQPDGYNVIVRLRQRLYVGRDTFRQIRVVGPNIRVLNRRIGPPTAQRGIRRITPDQKAHHLLDVLITAAQPVLHSQEPGAQILAFTGNKL